MPKNGKWTYDDFISHLKLANPNANVQLGMGRFKVDGKTPHLGTHYKKIDNSEKIVGYILIADTDILCDIPPMAYQEIVADNPYFSVDAMADYHKKNHNPDVE